MTKARDTMVVMPNTSLLNNLKRQLLKNSLRFATKDKVRGWALLGFLAILFIIGDYLFFKRILSHIRTLPLSVADILVPQFLTVICLTFFSMLIFSNIIASISTLYLSRDLDLLISSPIKIKNIYASRFIHTTINSSWMFLIFGIPIFIALGTGWEVGFPYYIGMIIAIIPFTIIPAGIGITITTILMRYFPAKKTHQFLTVVALLFMGGMVMFFRFLQPEKILGKAEIPMEVIQQYVENLKVPSYWFLPSTWMARTLNAGINENYQEMALWVGIAVTATLLLTSFCLLIVSKLYYSGWAISYSGRNGSEFKPRKAVYRQMEKLLWFLKIPLRAILLKDSRIFWRDPSQWTQIFMLAALVIIYIFNIRNLPMETLILKNFVSVMNIALASVVIAAIGVRFVFSTTSIEGRSFWLIKSAPINFSGYLWGKFFFFLAPLVLLAETLVVVSNMFLEVDSYLMAISIIGVFFLTVGITGLGVGYGALYPVFDFENIAELATSTGAIYYMLVSFFYIGVVTVFGIRPVWVHFSDKFLGNDVGGLEVYLCYGIVIALTFLAVYLPIKKGAENLSQLEH